MYGAPKTSLCGGRRCPDKGDNKWSRSISAEPVGKTGTTDANGDTTTFAYNVVGAMTALTDPVLNTTTRLFNNLTRVIEETNALGKTPYFEYDLASNLVEKTDRNGRVTEYDYDNLYRRTEERWLDSGGAVVRTFHWDFDAAGQLTSASDPAAAYDYVYDQLGRATSITHDLAGLSGDVVMTQMFDANSRRTQLAATIAGTPDFVNTFSYDGLNRLAIVEQASSLLPGANSVAAKRIDFAYRADDRFDTITRYADLAATQLVATSAYGYDQAGRLTDLAHAKAAAVFADYGWTWDAANRITSFTNSVHPSENATHSYDATSQLTAADRTGTTDDESYGYDANGNRTVVVQASSPATYTTGANNQLLSDGMFTYQYG